MVYLNDLEKMTSFHEFLALVGILATIAAFCVWWFRQSPQTIMILLVPVYAFFLVTMPALGDFLRWCAAI